MLVMPLPTANLLQRPYFLAKSLSPVIGLVLVPDTGTSGCQGTSAFFFFLVIQIYCAKGYPMLHVTSDELNILHNYSNACCYCPKSCCGSGSQTANSGWGMRVGD